MIRHEQDDFRKPFPAVSQKCDGFEKAIRDVAGGELGDAA